MSLLIRFMLAAVAVTTAFVNFISCGAQNYKQSLAGDHQEPAQGVQTANMTDPNSPEFGLHAPQGWQNLPIAYTVEKNYTDEQLKGLQAAISTWETAVGKKLFTYKGKTSESGSKFPDLFTSLSDNLNSMYDDDNWKKNQKSDQVLATTIWGNLDDNYKIITTADIHYNTQIYFIANALTNKPKDNREIVDMQSLATHEVGHLLGLAHVDESADRYSIMNPSLYIGQGMATRSLTADDIRRIQKIYGCAGSACDVTATAQAIQISSRQTNTAQNSNGAH